MNRLYPGAPFPALCSIMATSLNFQNLVGGKAHGQPKEADGGISPPADETPRPHETVAGRLTFSVGIVGGVGVRSCFVPKQFSGHVTHFMTRVWNAAISKLARTRHCASYNSSAEIVPANVLLPTRFVYRFCF